MENQQESNATKLSQYSESMGLVDFAVPKDSPSRRLTNTNNRRVLSSFENVPSPLAQPSSNGGRFGISQRIITNLKGNLLPTFGQSMTSNAATGRRPSPPNNGYSSYVAEPDDENMSSATSTQGSDSVMSSRSMFNSEYYELMTSTEDFLSDLYPVGHEYNGLGKRHVFRNVIKTLIEQQMLSDQMNTCEWRTKVCWSLLCQYGMLPRPITNQVQLAVLGCNKQSAVHAMLRPSVTVAQSTSEQEQPSYACVVYLSAVGGNYYRNPRPQLQDADWAELSADWLCLKVRTESSTKSGVVALPLSVDECTRAVQFLLKRYTVQQGSTSVDQGQSLIVCESADLVLPALSVAAAYVHCVNNMPLVVPLEEPNLSKGDTTQPSEQSTGLVIDETPSTHASSECKSPEAVAKQLNVSAFEYCLCVVPEVLVRLRLVLEDTLTCARHLPHLQQFARAVRSVRACGRVLNANAVSQPLQLSDQMGAHWTQASDWLQQGTHSAQLWYEAYTIMYDDLQQMASLWCEDIQSVTELDQSVCVVNAERAHISDVMLAEPTHVLFVSASAKYVKGHVGVSMRPRTNKTQATDCMCKCGPHTLSRLSLLSCSGVRESAELQLHDECNALTVQPNHTDFDTFTKYMANALRSPDARVMLVCESGVHEWMCAVLYSQYVYCSLGTLPGDVLCALAGSSMALHRVKDSKKVLSQLLQDNSALLTHWAQAMMHSRKEDGVCSLVQSIQSNAQTNAMHNRMDALLEQHTTRALPKHKCSKLPFSELNRKLLTLVCHMTCTCGKHTHKGEL